MTFVNEWIEGKEGKNVSKRRKIYVAKYDKEGIKKVTWIT